MQLSAPDATKFWPIYEEYDVQLAKLNDLRVAKIQEYASLYDEMTDRKADELIQKAFLIASSVRSFWENTMSASSRHWVELRPRAFLRWKSNWS